MSNARSGNYCQPRCDEATTEVQFVEPSAGSLQIIIHTTKLLIFKQDPSVEDVGTIDGILNAISPAITGSVAAEPEEVVASSTKVKDGRSYYPVRASHAPSPSLACTASAPCPPTKTTS